MVFQGVVSRQLERRIGDLPGESARVVDASNSQRCALMTNRPFALDPATQITPTCARWDATVSSVGRDPTQFRQMAVVIISTTQSPAASDVGQFRAADDVPAAR